MIPDIDFMIGHDQEGTFAEWYALRLAERTMIFRSDRWRCAIFGGYVRWWIEGEEQQGYCPADESAAETAARLGISLTLPGVFLVSEVT